MIVLVILFYFWSRVLVLLIYLLYLIPSDCLVVPLLYLTHCDYFGDLSFMFDPLWLFWWFIFYVRPTVIVLVILFCFWSKVIVLLIYLLYFTHCDYFAELSFMFDPLWFFCWFIFYVWPSVIILLIHPLYFTMCDRFVDLSFIFYSLWWIFSSSTSILTYLTHVHLSFSVLLYWTPWTPSVCYWTFILDHF